LTIVAVNFSAITDVLTIDATTELELYASRRATFERDRQSRVTIRSQAIWP
jgi:hypothetical protein